MRFSRAGDATASGMGRMYTLQMLAANEQSPGSFVAQEPFLAGDRVEVEGRSRHVKLYMPAGLGAVQHQQDSPVLGQPSDLVRGHAAPGGVQDVAHEDHACLGRERRLDLGYDRLAGVMDFEVHHFHGHPVALPDELGRRNHGAVLHVADDDFIALLPVQPAEYDIKALRGVAGDQHLIYCGVEYPCRGFPGLGLYFPACFKDVRHDRTLLKFQVYPVLHGLGHTPRRRARPPSIHVCGVRQHGYLTSDTVYVHVSRTSVIGFLLGIS